VRDAVLIVYGDLSPRSRDDMSAGVADFLEPVRVCMRSLNWIR
jgi:hypothetical protein